MDLEVQAYKEKCNELYEIIHKLERKLAIKDKYLQLMWEFALDYDGYTSSKALQGLIDELVIMMQDAMDSNDIKVVYERMNGKKLNILCEELPEEEE